MSQIVEADILKASPFYYPGKVTAQAWRIQWLSFHTGKNEVVKV